MNQDTEDLTERAPSLDRDGRAAYRVASNDWNLSATIVKAVSEVTGSDLFADERVLYDVIDPDALERLFDDGHDGTARTTGRVVFELRGCRVEVRADDEHVVYEPQEGHGESRLSAVRSA